MIPDAAKDTKTQAYQNCGPVKDQPQTPEKNAVD
jgi:hypothetical protein